MLTKCCVFDYLKLTAERSKFIFLAVEFVCQIYKWKNMVIYKASLKLQGFWQRVKESKSYLTNFSCIHEKTKPRCIKEDFATASVKLPRGHKGTHVRGTQRYLCSSKQNLHQYYHHIGYKYGGLLRKLRPPKTKT